MAFTAPTPWEAVAHWDGQDGRDHLADHPVASGPYRLVEYDKQARIVLEANPNWFGARHPEWRAPVATYPDAGEDGDREAGLLEPAGRPLPFIERIEFRREKESIPRFNKFLQGYYDASGIVQESFDKVIVDDRLSPEMTKLGVELEKSVDPSVFYLGFNMTDPVVGAPGGARARKLRQAMSLAIDVEEWTRLFTNGRGVPAQSPVPPGLFGYDAAYRNPWRRVDLDRARALLVEAGYPDGVDPQTGRPLRLTFDTYQTSAQGLTQIQFFVDAWRKLGIDVEISATTYNQFQEKARRGSFQIFMWGWVADYPDPENFFFLLWSEMARTKGGPNTANFSDPRFDELFLAMKARDDDAERARMIREMTAIVEEERPWIELFHAEDYALYHGWLRWLKPFGMSFPMIKYQDLDPARRGELRAEWNRPVRWPALALGAVALALVLPGIRTFRRERQ
jgi:ABC-type transport system substrate-binding protein